MLWSLLQMLAVVYMFGSMFILWVLFWLVVYDKDPIKASLTSRGIWYLLALVILWPYHAYLLFTDKGEEYERV